MSAPCACAAELADFRNRLDRHEARVSSLEAKFSETTGEVTEHDERLDEHQRALDRLDEAVRGMKHTLRVLTDNVERLGNVATVQGMTLERIEKSQGRVITLMEQLVTEQRTTNVLEEVLVSRGG